MFQSEITLYFAISLSFFRAPKLHVPQQLEGKDCIVGVLELSSSQFSPVSSMV